MCRKEASKAGTSKYTPQIPRNVITITCLDTWTLFQYSIRRLIVRSRKVSKPRDLYLELSDRSEIWQAPRQHCCRCAYQISERCDNLNYQSRGFETSRDLTVRRLIGYWNGALPPAQVWWTGTGDYVPEILLDIISCPCLLCLYMAHKSSYEVTGTHPNMFVVKWLSFWSTMVFDYASPVKSCLCIGRTYIITNFTR